MFIGNVKAVNLLNKSIENGKVNHAYLFSGPQNVGKFALAKIFSKSLIFGEPLKTDLSDFKNPLDLFVVVPEIEEKKGIVKEFDIKIEAVRNAQKKLTLFPYEGKYKILIIDNAHKMTVSSQNALLKTLEEPNETSIIILVTHDESKILPTIKSRCQKIKFSLVSFDEMRSGFPESENLILFSMGRPGLILKMKNNPEELEIKKKDLEILGKFSNLEINEKLQIAEEMAKNVSLGIERLEFWIWIIRSNAIKKNYQAGFFSFSTLEKIERVLEILKNTNANARLTIENLLLEI